MSQERKHGQSLRVSTFSSILISTKQKERNSTRTLGWSGLALEIWIGILQWTILVSGLGTWPVEYLPKTSIRRYLFYHWSKAWHVSSHQGYNYGLERMRMNLKLHNTGRVRLNIYFPVSFCKGCDCQKLQVYVCCFNVCGVWCLMSFVQLSKPVLCGTVHTFCTQNQRRKFVPAGKERLLS